MTEEGRVRLGSNGTYTYDYFLKDHLGNVRVILKTEDQSGTYSVYHAASMETATAATESTYYSNLDKVRNFTPVGFMSLKKNEKVAHLKGTDPNKQIGPSITVKVNSGDKISLTAQSFYPDNTGTQRTGLAETALSQLVNAIVNPAGLSDKGKAFATDNLKAQGFDKSSGYQNMMNKLPNSDYSNENNRPKAYMVWMLFDSEMKLVKTSKSSGARQIPEGAGQVKQMAENDIVMDQGGFLTAYTVNESPASVYIDNFQLSMMQGPVQEENTYYPFGMLNTGLSNSGLTVPINNYKYNGKELQTDLDLQWLDYGARFYDPVIGRFHTQDRFAEKYLDFTPYQYGANNPMKYIDINGDSTFLLTWATANGSPGHSALAVSNYKTEVVKDKNGNVIKDRNGNSVTKQVEDGTYTVYQLVPDNGTQGVGKKNVEDNVKAGYSVTKINSRDQLFNSDVSNCGENRAAEGIIGLGTDYKKDVAVKNTMNLYIGSNLEYNGISNNCTDFVKSGVQAASGTWINADEKVSGIFSSRYVTTPNQLYNQTRGLQNAVVLKNPGNAVNNSFIQGYIKRRNGN